MDKELKKPIKKNYTQELADNTNVKYACEQIDKIKDVCKASAELLVTSGDMGQLMHAQVMQSLMVINQALSSNMVVIAEYLKYINSRLERIEARKNDLS